MIELSKITFEEFRIEEGVWVVRVLEDIIRAHGEVIFRDYYQPVFEYSDGRIRELDCESTFFNAKAEIIKQLSTEDG